MSSIGWKKDAKSDKVVSKNSTKANVSHENCSYFSVDTAAIHPYGYETTRAYLLNENGMSKVTLHKEQLGFTIISFAQRQPLFLLSLIKMSTDQVLRPSTLMAHTKLIQADTLIGVDMGRASGWLIDTWAFDDLEVVAL